MFLLMYLFQSHGGPPLWEQSRLITEALLHFQTSFGGFACSATKTLITKGGGGVHTLQL